MYLYFFTLIIYKTQYIFMNKTTQKVKNGLITYIFNEHL